MLNNVITIDGGQGEGGGQILRTALTLSIFLQQPVEIHNIRSGRKKPGLLRQHLTCVKAATEIANADVSGDFLGSQTLSFSPTTCQGGNYHWAIGSAGSTTLVFQTVLLPLLLANKPSKITLEGGTHNGLSPSLDFIQLSFLPLLQRMIDCDIALTSDRIGFYPSAGGRWYAEINPLSRTSIENSSALSLLEKGALQSECAVATLANLENHVNERELKQVQQVLNWTDDQLHSQWESARGSGNILSLRQTCDWGAAVFESVAAKRVSAEQVAQNAIDAFVRYQTAGVPVCEHLADQLILPLLLTGGNFRTLSPSQHLKTQIALVNQLTGITISTLCIKPDVYEIRVPKYSLLATQNR